MGSYARSDLFVVLIALAVENRENLRLGGEIVECDLVPAIAATFLSNHFMEFIEVSWGKLLPLPIKVVTVRCESLEAPPGEMLFKGHPNVV